MIAHRTRLILALCSLATASASYSAEPARSTSAADLHVVVTDPLAAPLSCPCVAGYAQRKYEQLGEYLSAKLDRPVAVTFAETLAQAAEKATDRQIDVVIGKDSVIRHAAKSAKLKLEPLARLTDLDGRTTQTGLVVVRSDDPAKTVTDLKGYRVFFGPVDSDEKHAAAIKLLQSAKVETPKSPEVCFACTEGAVKIIELGNNVRSAAVISSYAKPLLEGCGTVKKGDLRVVGETAPVPFITAFTNQSLSDRQRETIAQALAGVANEPELCIALESLLGFAPIDEEPSVKTAGGEQASTKKN